MADKSSSSSGIGLIGMIFIVLFAGKVFEIGAVATWSWWLITAPLWGTTILAVIFIAVVALAS